MSKILVIDDNAGVRATIRHVLECAGFEVSCAEDGRQGMKAVREAQPDLVVLDIIMPEQEGIETIRQLRSTWRELPILAISGGGRIGNADFLQMAAALGASDTLAKPFEPRELISKVHSLLRP